MYSRAMHASYQQQALDPTQLLNKTEAGLRMLCMMLSIRDDEPFFSLPLDGLEGLPAAAAASMASSESNLPPRTSSSSGGRSVSCTSEKEEEGKKLSRTTMKNNLGVYFVHTEYFTTCRFYI